MHCRHQAEHRCPPQPCTSLQACAGGGCYDCNEDSCIQLYGGDSDYLPTKLVLDRVNFGGPRLSGIDVRYSLIALKNCTFSPPRDALRVFNGTIFSDDPLGSDLINTVEGDPKPPEPTPLALAPPGLFLQDSDTTFLALRKVKPPAVLYNCTRQLCSLLATRCVIDVIALLQRCRPATWQLDSQ